MERGRAVWLWNIGSDDEEVSLLKFWPEQSHSTVTATKLQTTWICRYPAKVSLLELTLPRIVSQKARSIF